MLLLLQGPACGLPLPGARPGQGLQAVPPAPKGGWLPRRQRCTRCTPTCWSPAPCPAGILLSRASGLPQAWTLPLQSNPSVKGADSSPDLAKAAVRIHSGLRSLYVFSTTGQGREMGPAEGAVRAAWHDREALLTAAQRKQLEQWLRGSRRLAALLRDAGLFEAAQPSQPQPPKQQLQEPAQRPRPQEQPPAKQQPGAQEQPPTKQPPKPQEQPRPVGAMARPVARPPLQAAPAPAAAPPAVPPPPPPLPPPDGPAAVPNGVAAAGPQQRNGSKRKESRWEPLNGTELGDKRSRSAPPSPPVPAAAAAPLPPPPPPLGPLADAGSGRKNGTVAAAPHLPPPRPSSRLSNGTAAMELDTGGSSALRLPPPPGPEPEPDPGLVERAESAVLQDETAGQFHGVAISEDVRGLLG